MASKKAGGSSRNGRTSNPNFLGLKASGGQQVLAGCILRRQRGSEFHPGKNVGIGRDFTLYAKAHGKVCFSVGFRKRRFIHIEPNIIAVKPN